MLVNKYKLIDIKNYESEQRVNILEYFNDIRIDRIIELIRLGNNNCEINVAAKILDDYLEDHSIMDAILEIKKALIGVGDNTKEETQGGKTINITKYKSLTDLYIVYCMQLLSVGLGYQEFWSMTTDEMYKVFNSIVIKIENDTNRELSNYHTLAAMVGSAVWGKLQKKPPKIDIVSKQEIEDMEDMDAEDIEMVAKLKSLAKKYEKGVNQNG